MPCCACSMQTARHRAHTITHLLRGNQNVKAKDAKRRDKQTALEEVAVVVAAAATTSGQQLAIRLEEGGGGKSELRKKKEAERR